MIKVFEIVLDTVNKTREAERKAFERAKEIERNAKFLDKNILFNSDDEDKLYDYSYNPNPRDQDLVKNIYSPEKEMMGDEYKKTLSLGDEIADPGVTIKSVGKDKGEVRKYWQSELKKLSKIDPFAKSIAEFNLFEEVGDPQDYGDVNPYIARSILDAEGYMPYREKNGRISIYGIGYNRDQIPKQDLKYAYNVFMRQYVNKDKRVKELMENASPEDQYAMAQFILHKPAIFNRYLDKREKQGKPLHGDDFIENMFKFQRDYYVTGNVRANDPTYEGERFIDSFKGVMRRVNTAEATWRKLKKLDEKGEA